MKGEQELLRAAQSGCLDLEVQVRALGVPGVSCQSELLAAGHPDTIGQRLLAASITS